MRRLLILTGLVVSVSFGASASERAYVYQITAEDCVNPLEVRVQTGFAFSGKDGIVTALHGIVGCRDISAVSEGAALADLTLDEVDLERDLGIVGPSNVPRHDGFVMGPAPTRPGLARVLGHPHAISGLHEMTLEIPDPPTRPLRGLAPPSLFDALRTRNSPRADVTVVSINGDLQPGHSGAPVLDRSGRVLGVASGGIGNGEYGIAWAMPLEDAQWQSERDVRAELDRLACLPSGGFFWLPGGAGEAVVEYPRRVSLWRYAEGRVSGVFADPTGNTVYVNTFQKIRRFDLDRESVSDVPVGSLIQGMALSPDARTAYVVDARPITVLMLVDLVNRRVARHIDMPQEKVCPPVMHPSGELLFVPLPNDDAIWVYDTRSERSHTARIDAQSPCAMAVSRRTSNIYVGSYPNEIRVFRSGDFFEASDVVEPRSQIRVGQWPMGLAESFHTSHLYVTNSRSNTVSVLDPDGGTEIAEIRVGEFPWGVAITPDSRWVYVANREDATVSVIDAAQNAVIETLQVDRDPTEIAITQSGDRVFVGHFSQNSVTLIE